MGMMAIMMVMVTTMMMLIAKTFQVTVTGANVGTALAAKSNILEFSLGISLNARYVVGNTKMMKDE